MKYIGDGLSFLSIFAMWFVSYCIVCAPEAMAADASHMMSKSTALYLTFALFVFVGLFWLFARVVEYGDKKWGVDRREYDEVNGHEHH